MDELLTSIIIVLILTVILYLIITVCKPGSAIYEWITAKPTTVCSDVDDRCYKISTAYDTQLIEAANLLATLNKDMLTIIRHMRDNYLWNTNIELTQGVLLRRRITEHMLARYNADVLVENVPWSLNETSYTQHKGEKMALCLREKQTGNHNIDEYSRLLFVALHELTHVSTDVKDHDEPFWYVFKVILQEAEKAGVYKPINYEKQPMNACGLPVAYNPYFDISLNESHLYHMIPLL